MTDVKPINKTGDAQGSQVQTTLPTPPGSKTSGEPARHPLPQGWTCDEVGPDARETCRNWFYKTACIRELLPRILVEVTRVLIKYQYRFQYYSYVVSFLPYYVSLV